MMKILEFLIEKVFNFVFEVIFDALTGRRRV